MKTTNDLESALRRLRELAGARGRRTSGEVIDLEVERRKRQVRTRLHNEARLPPRTGRGDGPDRNR